MAAWSDEPEQDILRIDGQQFLPIQPASYGDATNPLRSLSEGCPQCEGELAGYTGGGGGFFGDVLADAVLTDTERQHYRMIRKVVCTSCGWIGSAYKPRFHTNRDPGDEN